MLTIKEVIRTLYNALLQKLKNHRGDWNQNDPTADNYIKNRPFYTDDSENTVIIKKTNVAINMAPNGASVEGGFATITYSPVIEMIVGQSYVITWDGKDYECTAYEVDGVAAVGDSSLMMYRESDSTGEPFFIVVSKDYFNGAYICANEIGTHAVQIIQYGKVVPIDKKYIPSDMIDQDGLNVQLGYVYDDIDNVWNMAYGSVKYNNSQNLTTSQKAQARTNIGAVSSDEITGVLKYSESQTLTDAQKEIARENIGAGTSSFSGSYEDLTDVPDKIGSFLNTKIGGNNTYIGGFPCGYEYIKKANESCAYCKVIIKPNDWEEVIINNEIVYRAILTNKFTNDIKNGLINNNITNIIIVDPSESLIGGYDKTFQHLAYLYPPITSNVTYGDKSLYETGEIGTNGFLLMRPKGSVTSWHLYMKTNTATSIDINLVLGALNNEYKIKQLDEKFIPDTIARITDIPTQTGSWNDLTDKPFGETGATITWNGDTGSVEYFTGNYYWMSPLTPTFEELKENEAICNTYNLADIGTYLVSSESYSSWYTEFDSGYKWNSYFVVVFEDNATDGEIIFPKKGIYFRRSNPMNYTSSLVWGGIETLDDKFIPNTIQRVGDDLILNSSTEGSIKKFKLTIDDSGVLTATEIIE